MTATNAQALAAETARLIRLAGSFGYVKVHTDTLNEFSAYLSSTSAGVTDEQVEAAIYAFDGDRSYGIGELDQLRRKMRAALEASRSPVSQKEAVPVAWRYRANVSQDWSFVAAPWPEDWPDHYERRPLYASPAPSPAGEPAIKALEWGENQTAKSIGGSYHIAPRSCLMWVPAAMHDFGFYADDEAAIRAANRNHERSIRSALRSPAVEGK